MEKSLTDLEKMVLKQKDQVNYKPQNSKPELVRPLNSKEEAKVEDVKMDESPKKIEIKQRSDNYHQNFIDLNPNYNTDKFERAKEIAKRWNKDVISKIAGQAG
jgi:hypothetical protein